MCKLKSHCTLVQGNRLSNEILQLTPKGTSIIEGIVGSCYLLKQGCGLSREKREHWLQISNIWGVHIKLEANRRLGGSDGNMKLLPK